MWLRSTSVMLAYWFEAFFLIHLPVLKVAVSLSMPRPKVDPRFRRRVAQACENCKKRKSKCNGILPCDHCRARGVEDACRYSRYPRPASQESQLSRGLPNREFRREPGPLDPASPASSSSKQIDIPVSNLYSVSKDSQMLKDSRGKFSMFSEPNASENK